MRLLDDITDFFGDVMDAITSFFKFPKSNNKTKDQWDIKNIIMKYAESSLKSGYNIIRDSLPVLHIARESLNTVSFILPNVSVATFVKHFSNNVTPELIKNENHHL